jgi:hypothetical protein
MRKWALVALLTVAPLALSAAELILRDGTVVRGEFVNGNDRQITFRDQSGIRRTFDIGQIQTINFNAVESPAGAYNAPPQGQGYPPPATYNNQTPPPVYSGQTPPPAYNGQTPPPAGADRYGQPYGGDRDWAVVPAGTELVVRTDQNIDSRNASQGQIFPASIQRDITDASGNVVIPRGSPAQLVIRQIQEGGTFNNGSLVLDLEAVQVNGRWHHVAAADIRANDQQGIGANRRTGEMVGGGAVLGTLLGAIAGGGKGAAIGAIAGAAAGGGVQVATKGHEIRVPAETELRFRLERPLHFRQA